MIFLNSVYNKLYTEFKKAPYETKTASIYFEQSWLSIYFEQRLSGYQAGIYEEKYHIDKVIKVDNTQTAEFDEVFDGLLEIIFKTGKIPCFVILQSASSYSTVYVHVAENKEDNAVASPFRPRRKKLSKSGKKVGKKSDKKSGKVRKNKRSKKL